MVLRDLRMRFFFCRAHVWVHISITYHWAMSPASTSCHIRLSHMCACAKFSYASVSEYECHVWLSHVTCEYVMSRTNESHVRMWQILIRDSHTHTCTYVSVVYDMMFSHVTWLDYMSHSYAQCACRNCVWGFAVRTCKCTWSVHLYVSEHLCVCVSVCVRLCLHRFSSCAGRCIETAYLMGAPPSTPFPPISSPAPPRFTCVFVHTIYDLDVYVKCNKFFRKKDLHVYFSCIPNVWFCFLAAYHMFFVYALLVYLNMCITFRKSFYKKGVYVRNIQIHMKRDIYTFTYIYDDIRNI